MSIPKSENTKEFYLNDFCDNKDKIDKIKDIINSVDSSFYYCADLYKVKSGKVRTLADMSEEEIQKIEKEYGMKVIRPKENKNEW